MNFYIRIVDGKPFEHPLSEENLMQVVPNFDPNNLPAGDPGAFAKLSQENKDGAASKAWKDIWGAGQGVGLIYDIPSVAQIVDTLEAEYQAARKRLLG